VNGVPSSTGPVGATLTIQGSGFGATVGFSTVALNGTALAGSGVKPTSWSDNSIVAVIPKTASSGGVVVRVGGKTSNAMNFAIGAVVTGVAPSSGLAGTSVTITGNGFGTSGGTVTFNGVTANTNGWTDASIVAQVPKGAPAGPIVVSVGGQVSNGIAFTPTPSITSLSPNFGPSGTQITIAGSSFGNQQGASTVTFNGVAAPVNSWSNTGITVSAPSGALTGGVVVAVNGVPSAGQTFTYTPQITSLSPNPALAQTQVTIQGTNFGSSQAAGTVTFNGVAAVVTGWSNTSVSAIVPSNVTPGPVVVTVNGVGSNGLAFSLPPPYSFSVSFAPNGNVLSANDSVNGNWNYTYDDFDRLATSVNSNPQQGYSYVYDQYGNRWQQNLTSGSGNSSILTFTAATSAVSNGNCYHASGLTNQPDGYCYDAAGNLLSDGQHAYTYDAENRIISVDGGQTATYIYNGGGQRIRKVSASGTADYLYDLSGHTVTELSGFGAWNRSEIYAVGRHVGTYRNGTTYFVQADWLGTERTRVLSSGDLFETCASLPFGDGLTCTGSADPSPNHFTGKERDNESGLDYFGKRFYDNLLGRWTSADSQRVALRHLTNPQKLNKYAYVLNNPLSMVDPDGLEEIKVFVMFNAGDTTTRNQPNWGAIQKTAAAHGNNVYVYQGDKASAANYQASLASGGTTVFIGHTQSVDNGPAQGGEHVVAVSLTDKEVGQPSNDPNRVGAGRVVPNDVIGSFGTPVPGEMPAKVNGGTVAIFGCDATGLSSQYSGANNFVAVDSGADKYTSADGLLSAGSAFVIDLAKGNSLNTAVSDANNNLNKNPKTDTGDRVVRNPKDQQ
jgi:RHS repeat-associated protein